MIRSEVGSASRSDEEIEIDIGTGFDAGLDAAVIRMERAIRAARAGAGAISFDSSMADPERDLLFAMRALDERAISFSTEDGEQSGAEAGAKVARFLQRVWEQASAVTRVETRVDGQLLLSTRIGLSGDCTSALWRPSEPPELQAHMASLREQLQMRRARTRLLLATMQMAAKVALATGTANPWLVLPAVVRFIRDVLAEPRPIEPAA